jgi:septation ring formation regulator EzrA
VDESHFLEVEKALLYVSEARDRCARALTTLRRDGAESHLVEALEEAERDLQATHRRLMQQTLFAVPEDQLSLKS